MGTLNNPSAGGEWITDLTGLALAFGLVARAFYLYDDRDWLQSLADEEVFAETPFGAGRRTVAEGLRLLQSWSAAMRGETPEGGYEALRLDYTRLFVAAGPDFVPPWESVYFNPDRLVFQDETLEVRSWYRRFGLEPRNLHQEPDDHIALELAFAAELAQRAAAAAEKNAQEEFQRLLDAERDFLTHHLLRWAPECCRLIARAARTDFFRGIALLCQGFLEEAAVLMKVEPEGRTPRRENHDIARC